MNYKSRAFITESKQYEQQYQEAIQEVLPIVLIIRYKLIKIYDVNLKQLYFEGFYSTEIQNSLFDFIRIIDGRGRLLRTLCLFFNFNNVT